LNLADRRCGSRDDRCHRSMPPATGRAAGPPQSGGSHVSWPMALLSGQRSVESLSSPLSPLSESLSLPESREPLSSPLSPESASSPLSPSLTVAPPCANPGPDSLDLLVLQLGSVNAHHVPPVRAMFDLPYVPPKTKSNTPRPAAGAVTPCAFAIRPGQPPRCIHSGGSPLWITGRRQDWLWPGYARGPSSLRRSASEMIPTSRSPSSTTTRRSSWCWASSRRASSTS
jgi:hypothetical protein